MSSLNTLKVIAHPRTQVGKGPAKRMRYQAKVPCVLYGGREHLLLYIDMSYVRKLFYTPKVHFINLEINRKNYKCIIKDYQFHPTSDMCLHIDFLEISNEKKIQMEIPIRIKGTSPGIAKGGSLLKKQRKLHVEAYPNQIPAYVDVDISNLELGRTARVKDITLAKDYIIQEDPSLPVVTIVVPRARRSQESEEAKASTAKE